MFYLCRRLELVGVLFSSEVPVSAATGPRGARKRIGLPPLSFAEIQFRCCIDFLGALYRLVFLFVFFFHPPLSLPPSLSTFHFLSFFLRLFVCLFVY